MNGLNTTKCCRLGKMCRKMHR